MNNITNNDEILKELAELKEETIAVLDEIERVEAEIKAKNTMTLKEGMRQLKQYLDLTEGVGMSRDDAFAMLSAFSKLG